MKLLAASEALLLLLLGGVVVVSLWVSACRAAAVEDTYRQLLLLEHDGLRRKLRPCCLLLFLGLGFGLGCGGGKRMFSKLLARSIGQELRSSTLTWTHDGLLQTSDAVVQSMLPGGVAEELLLLISSEFAFSQAELLKSGRSHRMLPIPSNRKLRGQKPLQLRILGGAFAGCSAK